ncbi:MAG: ATP-binding cassette domain-containing protein [Bowdeniella nasicola]|nr:ATP-binding cassette domain-containing protein [Bowdeniella nasicola]
MNDVLRIESVNLTYGEGPTARQALADVDLTISSEGIHAVLGPSGSGKTTLLKVATGLQPPQSGEVYVAQQPIYELDEAARTRHRCLYISSILERENLVHMYSVRDNITLPAQLSGSSIDRARYREAIHFFDLAEFLDLYPASISAEVAQRAALARAVVSAPRLIVADEISGDLDSRSSASVLSLLRSAVREFNLTVLLCTHDPLAAAYADEAWLLSDGAIAGTVDNPTYHSLISALAVMRDAQAQLL